MKERERKREREREREKEREGTILFRFGARTTFYSNGEPPRP